MRVAYVTADIGPGAAPAAMPTLTVPWTSSSYGLVHVHGQPGTQAVPAPKPAALPPISQVRQTQPSYVAPDAIYPAIYTASVDNMHPPMGLLRDNPMPVPARNLYNMAGVAQRGRRVGGQSQIGQPAVAQTWPEWLGVANSGAPGYGTAQLPRWAGA